eukprot:CAMPEP_0197733642 /NCGR_PEP_ID=MMETSP1434-20131217/44011_1 /TAXON_ID=265543 /ORGANISM="Minutocellus polymorphus, Strain CCMP3303" /LENGTH=572 /DNA_ID=CAMNT_0043321027 /DNA_START=315 /DNA_END=2034 /DNA_ORIENTATION=-
MSAPPPPGGPGERSRRAARLEEEAPQFRSAPIAVARPPSLGRGMMGAGMGGVGVGGIGLDRVPGDYVGAGASAARSQFEEGMGVGVGGIGLDRVPGDYVGGAQFEEPKDDIRKLLAAENSKPSAAAASAPNAAAKDDASAAESNWSVDGGRSSLRSVPTYYPLEKSTRYVTGRDLGEITAQISDCCRIMSVHAEYEGNDDVPGTAYLRTSEHVEIQLQLWHGAAPRHPDGCVIVEAQRRRGDAVTFHKYSRNLLDAATGTFQPATYVSLEDREAEYCHKAEAMLVHHNDGQKKPSSSSIGGAGARTNTAEHENALLALEIAASLLKKDRMDARQLGMESLCLLTDPTRTGVETALIASRVVLTGSTQDESQDDAAKEDDYDADQWGIREAILALVQFGRLGDDGGFEQDSDSDDDSCTGCSHSGGGVPPDEQRHNDMLHNLALAVLANALDVLENHGARLCEAGSESPSSVADAFLSDSHEMMEKDLLKTLLGKLGDAEVKPHDATLSAKCLRSLCEASKDARRRARDLKAKQIVQTALEVGQRTHVKLEKESQKVIHTLAKAEEETTPGDH